MPLMRHSELNLDESNPDLKRRTMINAALGAGHLEVGEVTIAPGKSVPLHIHATHEEGMYIIDGPLNFVLGDETGTVNEGDMILAPAGVKHDLSNPGQEPRRIMFIFPTTNIQRTFL